MQSKQTNRRNKSDVTSGNINLVLLHGYAETPDKVWFPWIHRQAEELGWRVWAPYLPSPLKPEYGAWRKIVDANAAAWDSRTIIVGHSMGGALAVQTLQRTKRRVGAVITVSAPFSATVPVRQIVGFFNHPIDWPFIRRRAGQFVTIHAKNDPIIPHDHAFRYQELLNSKIVVTDKEGHFLGRQAEAVWREIKEAAAAI